jgi:hypothetical protein
MNRTSRFRLRASSVAPIEDPLWCKLFLSGNGGFAETLLAPIVVGDSMNEPLGPDAYGYLAYDDQDIGYAEHPQYNWVEIKETGTQVILGDDDTRVIDLPPEFGPIYYYGQRTTKLSVCSNGWVAPDTSTRCDFNNIYLPDPLAPQRIIALLWDNFDPTAFGWIGYYHDAPNHRFIVEYDSVPYFPQYQQWEKFEIIFYDTTLAGPTGDNVFVVQYATASGIGSVSAAMQNNEGTAGLNYCWNARYPRQAAPIVPGRAIKYRAQGSSALAERLPAANYEPRTVKLTCVPNPVSGRAEISYALPVSGNVDVVIYDAAGRTVKSLATGHSSAGRHLLNWDARQVPEGIYFCRLETEQGKQNLKLIVTR